MNTRFHRSVSLLSLASASLLTATTAFAVDLPDGYSEIPYLQSDGTAYLDTGYHLTATSRLDIAVDLMDVGGDVFPFGCSDVKYGGDSAKMQLWWESYNNGGIGYVGTPGTSGYYMRSSGNLNLSTGEYRDCRITYDSGVVTIVNNAKDSTCVYNGAAGWESSDKSYVFINSLHLFGRKGNGSNTTLVNGLHNKSRFRRVKAYEGDMLVLDLVPAYSETKVCLGMYDLVGGEFHANGAASGSFTTEEITGDRRRLAYLGGTGAQYVETDYVFKTRPRVECGIYVNSTTDSDVMGNHVQQAGCFIIDYNDGNRTLYYRYGNSNGNSSMTASYPTAIKGQWVQAVYDTTVTHDGVQVGTEVASYDFSANTQTFRIFQGRYTNMAVRYSYLKLYDGDVLVRDYIPAEVNGVAGLWDRLTQTLATNAGTGIFETGFAVPAKPGDFSVFEIVGAPSNRGTVSPGYGVGPAVPGASAVCTATPPAPTDTEHVLLLGWEVYYDDALQTSGNSSTANFTYGDGRTTLKWLWGGEFKLDFDEAAHGSVTNTSGWYAANSVLPLKAVADTDYEFVCWKGVPEDGKYDNPLMLTVDQARTVEPVFASVNAKRLEYIGSNNSQQWIDTGYVPTNKPGVVARAKFMDTGDKDFVGMAAANANCFMVDYADGNKALYYRYAAAGYTSAAYGNLSGPLTGKWFDFAWSNVVWHGEYKVHTVAAGWEGGFAANKQSIRLFGGRTFGQIYYGPVKIYDGDELVRDFIPVKINGVAGMWDRVERKFYGNANANHAAFVEGPVVAIEDGDFAVSHTVTASDGGTAEISDAAAPMGELVTLTATPANGYVFAGWEGNVPAACVADPNPTFVVTGPIVAQALFAKSAAYLVDPAGGGDFTTIAAALAATADSVGTIKIKSGFYDVPELLHVTGRVLIEPESGVTGDVVLWTTNRNPVISVENQLARLSHLVVSNGYTTTSTPNYGGNVTITAGLVEDCLIVNGHNGKSATYGDKVNAQGGPAAGVYLTSGTLRNSTIRGNFANYDAPGKAVGIYANGSDTLVDGCVVCCNTNLNNYRIDNLYHAGAIKLVGGTVRNCVLTNNVNLGHATIYVSGNGTVEDTLVKDNVSGFYFDTLSGGAFVPSGEIATFTRCTFTGNSGFGVGGIYNAGTVNLTDVHCYGNTCAATGFAGEPNVRGVDLVKVDLTDPRDKPAQTTDVYVNPGDDLSAAVERCADGGTVHLAAGNHPVKSELFVDRPITLKGEGYGCTSISVANDAPYSRALNLRVDGAVVEGLAITNGQFLAANCVNLARGTIRNCLIGHSTRQGALIIWNGTVRDSVIQNCNGSSTYAEFGTAVDLEGPSAVLEDSIVENSRQGGNVSAGADVVRVKDGVMRRCEIRGNSADGGSTAVIGMAGGRVENCVIHDNDSSWNGAGMLRAAGSDWDVRNCTVVSNKAWFGGAVWWATNGNVVARSGRIVNTIFRGNWSKVLTENQQLEDLGEVFPGNGTKGIDVVFSNCCFETVATIANQGARAAGCFAADPRFRNLAQRDFRLAVDSPCRHTGVLWPGAREATDPRGRPVAGIDDIDVGAYATSKTGFFIQVK